MTRRARPCPAAAARAPLPSVPVCLFRVGPAIMRPAEWLSALSPIQDDSFSRPPIGSSPPSQPGAQHSPVVRSAGAAAVASPSLPAKVYAGVIPVCIPELQHQLYRKTSQRSSSSSCDRTRPCQPDRGHVQSLTPPGTVISPPPWAACSNF